MLKMTSARPQCKGIFIALTIQRQKVDDAAQVRADLAAHDQEPAVFHDAVRIGLKPAFEDAFLMPRLKRFREVLPKPTVRFNTE